ncbi:MAG: hypothetical protein AAGB31_09185, partial [Bdellovibrio sp.]
VNCRSLASSGEETLPTNTVECEAKYGPGWFYENGACVPPNGADCNHNSTVAIPGATVISSGGGWFTYKIPNGVVFQKSAGGCGSPVTIYQCHNGQINSVGGGWNDYSGCL